VERVKTLRSHLAIRLALILVAVTAVGMLAMGLYITSVLEAHSVEGLKSGLVTQARLIHDAVVAHLGTGAPPDSIQGMAAKYGGQSSARVTIIVSDGTVLGDSERDLEGVRRMENHAGRPEVRAALAGRTGSHLRRSDTLNVEMLYVAIPLVERGGIKGVLRIALPMTAVARNKASENSTKPRVYIQRR